MAMKCYLCGKGKMIGRQHKHHPGVAGGRWKRRAPHTLKIFKPNLHSARIQVDGFTKRVRLCTKCLRIVKEDRQLKKNSIDKTKEPQTLIATS
ncbi:MAG: 50S ribosomal protein L28 [Patescibacteria group bacterium]|nr:50S ribosomal protein L28 [Patescibacteria group bacterium]